MNNIVRLFEGSEELVTIENGNVTPFVPRVSDIVCVASTGRFKVLSVEVVYHTAGVFFNVFLERI